MRLTDDIFKLSDRYHSELVKLSCALASSGRFGLMPSAQPFHLELDVKKSHVEVTALQCLAVTKDGSLIEASFDSRFSGAHDTCADFMNRDEGKAYWLLISATENWVDDNEDSSLPVYSFSVVEEFSRVPDNALPIARIVFDLGWREDDVCFVPPCLLLSAHPKYAEAARHFQSMLACLDVWVPQNLQTASGDARRVFWPVVREMIISLDKEADILSPAALLVKIQNCVSSFYCACTLDENLQLSDEEDFQQYALGVKNVRAEYEKIQEGLALVERICKKLENLKPYESPSRPESPYIPEEELHQNAVSNTVFVRVEGLSPDADAYYSLDGSVPAVPLNEGKIRLNPGFSKSRTKETDKTFHVRLKAVKNGQESEPRAFEIVITKNVSIWSGPQI